MDDKEPRPAPRRPRSLPRRRVLTFCRIDTGGAVSGPKRFAAKPTTSGPIILPDGNYTLSELVTTLQKEINEQLEIISLPFF